MLQIKRFLSSSLVLALGIVLLAGPAAGASAKAPTKAVITLADGHRIKLVLYPDVAPLTVANFQKLAGKGFYNGLTFHRVEPGFVVQGGDPNGNGTGGPGWTVKGEFSSKPHIRGTLAMARAQDPDSAGSQFYICLAPAPFLDGKYTVFGQVTKGMEYVDKIKIGDKMTKVEVLP
jgi:cyclophilin family peptidyl-prolyl cis-trans isomerase